MNSCVFNSLSYMHIPPWQMQGRNHLAVLHIMIFEFSRKVNVAVLKIRSRIELGYPSQHTHATTLDNAIEGKS